MTEAMPRMLRRVSDGQGRSRQRDVGMSELGGHCDRQLALKLLQLDAVNHGPKLAALRGTGLHTVLEEAMRGDPRWLVEAAVAYGGIRGHVDLFDLRTGTVWDHKLMSKAKIKRLVEHGPSRAHRWQLHLYGAGLLAAGHTVNRVGLLAWPLDGHDEDSRAWGEPFDVNVADEALAHHDRVARAVADGGPRSVPMLAGPLCRWCPYWVRGSDDTDTTCGGNPQ